MASNDTAALVVALSAQLTKFEKAMADAGTIADKGVKDIEGRFAKMNPDASGLIAWGKQAFGIIGVAAFLDKLKEVTLEVGKLGQEAQRVGVSAEQFQELRYAAVATGGSIESAGSFLEVFNRKVSDAARGQGELYKVFRENGVALRDSNGNMLSTNALLGKFADLVKNAKSGADQMNLAVLAGGRSAGPELVRALQGGAIGLQEFAEKARAAGAVIDNELVERAEKVAVAWETKKLRMQTTLAEWGVLFAEEFGKAKDNVTDINRKAAEEVRGYWQSLMTWFEQNADPSKLQILKDMFAGAKGALGSLSGPAATSVTVNKPSGAGTTIMPSPQDEEFRKMLEHQRRRAELLQAEAQTIGQTVGREAELRAQIELESQAREHNIPLTEARKAAIEAEAAAVGKAAQQLDDYKRKWQGTNEALRYGGGLLVDALDAAINKTQTWQETATAALRSVTRELLQAAITGQGALAQILGFASNVPGGTGGLVGSLARAFGLGLPGVGGGTSGGSPGGLPEQAASGTDFAAGGPTLVGEQGPEFVNLPRGSQVIPNNVVRNMGGGDINVTLSMDLTGVNGEESMARIAEQAASRATQRAVAIANATAPARQQRYNLLGV